MGSFSAWHWIIVLVVVVLLFGAKRIPNVMGDVAKGIKSFRAGLKDDAEAPVPAPAPAPAPAAAPGPAMAQKAEAAKPVDAPKV